MKKKAIISIIVLLILAAITPIVPIGSRSNFIDLRTGDEITRKSCFMGLLLSRTVKSTVLSSKWPKPQTDTPESVLISRATIYLFSEKYIDFKVARRYYQLKNQDMAAPSSVDQAEINDFLRYCRNLPSAQSRSLR